MCKGFQQIRLFTPNSLVGKANAEICFDSTLSIFCDSSILLVFCCCRFLVNLCLNDSDNYLFFPSFFLQFPLCFLKCRSAAVMATIKTLEVGFFFNALFKSTLTLSIMGTWNAPVGGY